MPALPDTRMPGVITQEIPTLPPSIALVPSAVPVFIGYTEKASKNGNSVINVPTRIKSLQEYEIWFGGSPKIAFDVKINANLDTENKITGYEVTAIDLATSDANKTATQFIMHLALQLYFNNGGGPCYIISVATFGGNQPTFNADDFAKGIEVAKKAKDITILVIPELALLKDTADPPKPNYPAIGGVISKALMHCNKMINRVMVIDVPYETPQVGDPDFETFKNNVPSNIDLKKYGAAYFPFLKTTLTYNFSIDGDIVSQYTENGKAKAQNAPLQTKVEEIKSKRVELNLYQRLDVLAYNLVLNKTVADKDELKEELKKELQKADQAATVPAKVSGAIDAAADLTEVSEKMKNLIEETQGGIADSTKQAKELAKTGGLDGASLEVLQEFNNLLYNQIIDRIRSMPVILPPSAAIAGIYAFTDANQGVWKAPANTSVSGITGPAFDIDDDLHASLNVDSNSGKSINAIRTYTGKGTLVFGARTLAGNDLEWRYVNVRRTFCFIEDSIARAMQDFVFAPNSRATWIKVKAMIGNFLNEIWKAGGLFGDTPADAYRIEVGVPESMTEVDILEGRMIVNIKIAVVRPAEFIILRYEHKFNATNN